MSGYDPMTGEPIEETTEENPIVGYDPMTGDPIRENEQTSEQEVNFDPMTGKPIEEKTEEAPIVGYDPMTGEPIRDNEQMQQYELSYDPMTGKPIAPPVAYADTTSSKGGKKALLIVIAALAAVVILVVGIIFSGVFKSAPAKIIAAFENTFKETSGMVDALKGFDVALSGSYEIGMELDVEGEYMELYLASDKNEKQISGSLDIDDVPEIEFLAGIDSSQVKLQVPDLTDYLFVYNYTEEKDGYLVDYAGDDVIEAIDVICEMLYSPKVEKDDVTGLVDMYKEVFYDMEFETVDKKEYEVDGKDRTCKGYRLTLTEDDMIEFIDVLEENVDEDYRDALEEMDMDIGDMYDDLRDDVEGMDDVDITFYLYKNKVACVKVEDDDNEAEILFKGSEKGMHNIAICQDDEVVFELIGSVDGSVETYVVEELEEETITFTYDTKSGDYEYADEYDNIMKGNLMSDSKGATFTIEEVEEYGYETDMTITITAKKGAKMQEFEGEEFDLGNATEDDFMDLISEFY